MQVCPPPWPLAVVPGHALSTAVGLGGKPPCCTAITQPAVLKHLVTRGMLTMDR